MKAFVAFLACACGGAFVWAQEPAAPSAAPAAAPATEAPPAPAPAPGVVIDAFLKACRENPALNDAQKHEIATAVEQQAADPESVDGAITAGLRVTSPEFAQALELLGEENTAEASKLLEKLAASGDRFLAAEAVFYLARGHIMDEAYEESLPLLGELTGEKFAGATVHAGEALFLKGVAHAELLQRPEAEKALALYLEQNPAAPERLRVGAQQRLAELKVVGAGSIGDVQDRMDYSRRRLALERTDDPTQKQQETIIAMLDKLIKEAEECECSGAGGGGSGRGRGRGRSGGQTPSGGAQDSGTQIGKVETGPLSRLNKNMPEGWGGLKDKEREEVLSALKEKFPDRYKELIEQYYRSLQDEEEEAE